MGLVRDIVLTGLLGAGVALDAFVVMMKIPSVFRRLFAQGAFNQAFIPVLAEYKENISKDSTNDSIDKLNDLKPELDNVYCIRFTSHSLYSDHIKMYKIFNKFQDVFKKLQKHS